MSDESHLILERGDPDEAHDLAQAQEVLQVLCDHYPLHFWQVHFQGRVLVVRHGLISDAVRRELGRDGIGFLIKHADSFSARDLHDKAVRAGGELLEMFGFKRGAWDGQMPVIPATWKPRRPETFGLGRH
jgi:hypothetical protein